MAAKTTTKKKKPKCTKGTACGYSCIAAGKVCNQPVPEDVAEVNLDAVPARGKKSRGKKKTEPKADEQKKPKGKFLYIKTEDGGKIPVTGDGPVDREEDAYMGEKELKRVKKELAKKGVETEIGEAEEKPKEAAKRDKSKQTIPDDDTEAIQEIKRLDNELGTENYTPLSEFRKKFPDSTDKEFQDRINKLSRGDFIDISKGEGGEAKYLMLTDKSEEILKDNPPKYKPSKPIEEIDKDLDEALTAARDESDKEAGDEDFNYTPIYKVRDKLKSKGLNREDVDQALYRLSREDKIDLSSLVDPTQYTFEQVEAGIPKAVGGRLFFIVDNRPKKKAKKK